MRCARDIGGALKEGSPVAAPQAQQESQEPHGVLPAAGLRVAYLINQYPKVSHSFIRREILALERRGLSVDRIAIRGWDGDVVDAADIEELHRTRYVLKGGIGPLIAAAIRAAFARPQHFFKAFGAAFAMSRKSERALPYHMVYLAQACLVFEWLSESEASHLHAHFGTNPAEVAMLVRLLGGPQYSYTAHGPEENDRGAFLGIEHKVHHAKFVAAISSHTRSQLLRRAQVEDWSKIEIVRCGLDNDFLSSSEAPLPSGSQLICVARMDAEKGQMVLLEAMQQVCRLHPSCRLILAGDGAMRGAIEARVRELGLDANVEITGWLTGRQVREAIIASRALVLPSFQEGLPVVIMEAMALKRPVIATHIAGVPELVRNGVDGWLVPAGSVAALVEAMDACLMTPIEDLGRIGETAHARVLASHSIDHEAAKLVALFNASPCPEQVAA